jgi:hypothetical protein
VPGIVCLTALQTLPSRPHRRVDLAEVRHQRDHEILEQTHCLCGDLTVWNGIELYAVTACCTESEIANMIFLMAFLILIVASILLGQIFVRRRWSAGVRWAGLFLLLAAPLAILILNPTCSRRLLNREDGAILHTSNAGSMSA